MVKEWTKYQHVERLGTPDVDGILDGEVFVFPKLDGANASVFWYDSVRDVVLASRNLIMTREADGLKMYPYLDRDRSYPIYQQHLKEMAYHYPDLIFYGEWLAPHVIRDYRSESYYQYYLFDVWDTINQCYIPYDKYILIAQEYGVNYIPVLSVLDHPTIEQVEALVDENHYLMKTDEPGEGIVIKRYGFVNQFGRTTWAKIVRSEFKQKFKAGNFNDTSLEMQVLEPTLTYEYVAKEYMKLMDEGVIWNDKLIPQFMKTVWAEWWKDCSFDALMNVGNDSINMKQLRKVASGLIVKHLKAAQRSLTK